MNWYLLSASVLAFAIGLAHSVLGERLIFRRMRSGGLVPTRGAPVLHESHVRILWASWHVVTAMGWCVAAVLAWLAWPSGRLPAPPLIASVIVAAMLAGALLVLVGTRGRHPGWVGLLGVAVLAGMGFWSGLA
jgi:hypothetical protein